MNHAASTNGYHEIPRAETDPDFSPGSQVSDRANKRSISYPESHPPPSLSISSLPRPEEPDLVGQLCCDHQRDFKNGDPGIMTQEQLCLALTALAYCSQRLTPNFLGSPESYSQSSHQRNPEQRSGARQGVVLPWCCDSQRQKCRLATRKDLSSWFHCSADLLCIG